jgi:hypothetical protein
MMQPKQSNSKIGTVVLIVVVFAVLAITTKTNILLNNDKLAIKGMYGEEIPYAQIEEIKLLDEMPKLGPKRDSVGLGLVDAGIYQSDEYGYLRVFIGKKEKPYLLVRTRDETILIGMGKDKDEELYAGIEKKIQSR